MRSTPHFFAAIVILSMFLTIHVSAKQTGEIIQVQWQHGELITPNRQSFSNELHLTNLTGKSIRVNLSMSFDDAVHFTKKLPDTLLLKPEQKITLKVAGTRLMEKNEPCIITAAITSGNTPEIKKRFALFSEKIQNPVKVIFDNQSRYFTASDDTISIPLKMQNNSALKQLFSYSIRDEANGLDYILEDQNPWLEAYESKMFLLKIFRNQQFKDFLSYKLNVSVYDQYKNSILNLLIPVQSVSSVYRMNNPGTVNKGELSVEYRSLKDVYQVSDIRYTDKVKFDDGYLSFQVRHQYYFKQRLSQLFNSYLQWNNDTQVIKIGEVYTSGELSSYGNGFYTKNTGKTGEHELWGIFNAGYLYSSAPVFSRSKKVFGYSFTRKRKNTGKQYQFGFIHDINNGGYGPLLHAKEYINLPNGRIEAGLGISKEFSTTDNRRKPSMAAELLYRQKINKWVLESNIHFTGSHYLGQSRGLQTIATSARHLFSTQKQFYFGQYWLNTNPEYYTDFLPRQYAYQKLFSEYTFRKGNSAHTIKGVYQIESLGAFYSTGASSLYSTILGYDIEHSFKGTHWLHVSAEIAFEKLVNGSVPNNFTAFRTKAQWRYRNISSRLTWQNGVFNLNHYSFFNPGVYEQVEWLTQYRLLLHNPKLETSVQFGLYKEDFYESIRSRIIIDMSYHPTANLGFSIGVTKLANFFWQQPEWKLGFTFRPSLLKPAGNKNVRIRTFSDKNGNAKKDAGEEWAPNVEMRFNGRMLRTNAEGMVQVQNIPKGNYTLDVGNNSQVKNILVTQNEEMHVPFEVMYTVKGKFILTENNIDTAIGDLLNRIIRFKPAKGEEYLASTAVDGSFRLQLPKGNYQISIQGLKDIILNNTNGRTLAVENDIINAEVRAETKGRARNYQILAMQ